MKLYRVPQNKTICIFKQTNMILNIARNKTYMRRREYKVTELLVKSCLFSEVAFLLEIKLRKRN